MKLQEQHFRASPVKCVVISPRIPLSQLKARQLPIVVFGEFVPAACLWIELSTSLTLETPRILSSDPPPPTLSEMFHQLKIVTDTPSEVSNLQTYKTLQRQPQQRILDDRPSAGRFIPPTSLLYNGFGYFDDVVNKRRQVPGESSILETKLWDEVDTSAARMAQFYDSEAVRRGIVLYHLRRIFRARRIRMPREEV